MTTARKTRRRATTAKQQAETLKAAGKMLNGPPEYAAAPVPPKVDEPTILDKTSPLIDRFKKANEKGFDPWRSFHLDEVEMRIGLLARLIVEQTLRNGVGEGVSRKDLTDIALRAITTFEGSKTDITWKDEFSKRVTPKSVDAVESERKRVEERLKRMLMREKAVEIDAAKKALQEAREQADNSDGQPDS